MHIILLYKDIYKCLNHLSRQPQHICYFKKVFLISGLRWSWGSPWWIFRKFTRGPTLSKLNQVAGRTNHKYLDWLLCIFFFVAISPLFFHVYTHKITCHCWHIYTSHTVQLYCTPKCTCTYAITILFYFYSYCKAYFFRKVNETRVRWSVAERDPV